VHDGNRHPEHEDEVGGEPMAIETRSEGGSWSTVVSLLALALIGLMLLHACMSPAATGPAANAPASSVSR
jgi:hypothetical protein